MPDKQLQRKDLRNECDLGKLDFKTTDDVKLDSRKMVGQDRALHSIGFGLNIESEGFNLYVSGPSGTGRNTTIADQVKKAAKDKPAPEDICYLYNFQNPDEPKAIKLPPGVGLKFKKDVEEFIKELRNSIQKSFSSDQYQKQKKQIMSKFEQTKEALQAEMSKFAKEKGFSLQQTAIGIAAVPTHKGKPLSDQDYDQLSEKDKNEVQKKRDQIYEKLYDISKRIREKEKQAKEELKGLDKKVGLYAIEHLLDDLVSQYSGYDALKKHFEAIKDDLVENLDAFKQEEKPKSPLPLPGQDASKKDPTFKYQVNLLVDNNQQKGAPVISEHNPTYYNLTGYVEYKAKFGVLSTDFTMIKPGAFHKANGGYLIIQASQILRDYFAWDALKKILRYKKVKMENLGQRYGFVPTTGLKPEPLPVDVKVIIIGNPLFYRLLFQYDEDFRKLFKVKADFDISLRRDDDIISRYTQFIARKAKEEKMLSFDQQSVAKIIDYASRLSSDKKKLTARFNDIVNLMAEANYWAKVGKDKLVKAEHIKKAISEKIYRSNMIEEKIKDFIEEGTILIDTKREVEGQINGIAILSLGDYIFGKPSRITARTFMGKGNIIDIEREAKMGGKIHSKGVLILSGYLGQRFAQDKPLALSASICFEQLYEEVEGDSASSAELYCLLSSLSGCPLRQDIAVTGSVNQRGQIQAVGAINEKIEGFFEVCKIKGLGGKEGVIIPESNVKHLMLKDEVVEAVDAGRFHIYPVKSVEEGIEILTGKKAGKQNKDGTYPKNTVFAKVDDQLRKYAQLLKKKVSQK
ncbi:MAG: AAA family ATPase [Candidatus Omnitrophica bacterium]|nr:AAA family ATPase [Candidatus Omnitrophota bacterium]MCF7909909.1 AAA family ATPase [Candidatus Omnitrophota bacterium]